ncbi:MAG: hypothetical protein EPO13_00465 [Actinomycetota bacterium]|nr:MAG: hypothetical protein EPO13_00465 [Actinomycetota bacterium]
MAGTSGFILLGLAGLLQGDVGSVLVGASILILGVLMTTGLVVRGLSVRDGAVTERTFIFWTRTWRASEVRYVDVCPAATAFGGMLPAVDIELVLVDGERVALRTVRDFAFTKRGDRAGISRCARLGRALDVPYSQDLVWGDEAPRSEK